MSRLINWGTLRKKRLLRESSRTRLPPPYAKLQLLSSRVLTL